MCECLCERVSVCVCGGGHVFQECVCLLSGLLSRNGCGGVGGSGTFGFYMFQVTWAPSSL